MSSISVTGHVDAGERSIEAVRRALREELELHANHEDFRLLFSSRREEKLSPTYIDRQINDVYTCWLDFDIQNLSFSRTEVSEIQCVLLLRSQTMVESGDGGIVPAYGDDLKRVVPLV